MVPAERNHKNGIILLFKSSVATPLCRDDLAPEFQLSLAFADLVALRSSLQASSPLFIVVGQSTADFGSGISPSRNQIHPDRLFDRRWGSPGQPMLRVIELIKVVLGLKYPPFAIAAEIMASHHLVFIPKHKTNFTNS